MIEPNQETFGVILPDPLSIEILDDDGKLLLQFLAFIICN